MPANWDCCLLGGEANMNLKEGTRRLALLLSTGPSSGTALGGEFNLEPTTPEPGTLIMFGSGVLGLAGLLRRKISLW